MSPRLIIAWRMLGAKREAAEDLRRFAIMQHAVNANKKQAEKFLADLTAMAEFE